MLVLEAMKMENLIKSPTDGIIDKVVVQSGDKTEKNQVLIHFV
jgi:biotin carboxyl carrier protein